MNNKPKKKLIKNKSKAKSKKVIISKESNKNESKTELENKNLELDENLNTKKTPVNQSSCLFQCNGQIINKDEPLDEINNNIIFKSILEYPVLDPKAMFESFITLKSSKIPLKTWYEDNIPEQDYKLKGPIKAKLKKIKDNFRKLSKLCGSYGNCSTNPIGTSVWHNCMMHACQSNKTDNMNFKAHKLVGTGGQRVELNKKSFTNQNNIDDAWNEITHFIKYVRKEDLEMYYNKNNNINENNINRKDLTDLNKQNSNGKIETN